MGRLVVSVRQMPVKDSLLEVKYTLDPSLTRAAVWPTPEFVAEHDRRHRSGELDHPLDDRDLARMLPVKRWVNGKFQPLAIARD